MQVHAQKYSSAHCGCRSNHHCGLYITVYKLLLVRVSFLLSTGPSTPPPPAAGASHLPALSLVGFHLLISPIEGLHVFTGVHAHFDWQDLSHLLNLIIILLL